MKYNGHTSLWNADEWRLLFSPHSWLSWGQSINTTINDKPFPQWKLTILGFTFFFGKTPAQ